MISNCDDHEDDVAMMTVMVMTYEDDEAVMVVNL